jgi:hypothetical protein
MPLTTKGYKRENFFYHHINIIWPVIIKVSTVINTKEKILTIKVLGIQMTAELHDYKMML